MKVLNKPVDMISYCSNSGSITPVKFKIKDSGETLTIKVDRIIDITKTKYAGKPIICYTCETIINDIEKRYEVRFFPDTLQWVIYKM